MEKSRSYAGLFIIHPEKQETIEEVKNKIASIINDNSGNIIKDNLVGKKKLAYPIKKKTEGFYYEVFFKALPESIIGMMKEFRIDTDIMRTLIDKEQKSS